MTNVLLTSGGEGGHGGEESLGGWILHHLQDANEYLGAHLPQFEPVTFLGLTFDFSITTNLLMMWLAGFFLVLVLGRTFRNAQGVPKGRFANMLEAMALFVRDEIAVPNIGPKLGTQLTPFLCTLFFFILTLNLMGLIPIFHTATGSISVTAGLALIAFAMIQVYGIRKNGLAKYLGHFAPKGIPIFLLPIIIPIEILGQFTKPFALAMRLFANMVAGHTVIYALLGLIIVIGNVGVAAFSVPMAVAINMLELFVAFLQAFIFTILTALFIGMAVHSH